MRVLIYTFGSRGDIQPYLALARRLGQAGHQAAVCTAEGFRAQIEAAGVDYLHMSNELLQLAQEAMPTMSGARDAPRLFRAMGAAQRAALQDQWAAARTYRPTVVVYHPKALGGYHVAEKLGVPGVLSLPLPFFTATRDFPIPLIGRWPLGGRANHASYQLQRAAAVMYGTMINGFRNQLGLPPIRRTSNLLTDHHGRPVPILYPFSKHVRPVPADYPPHAHVTGYWFLDHDPSWRPSPALQEFLDAGPPPIYVGFGSMGFGRGADQRYAAIGESLARVGLRAVLASGWSRDTLPSSSTVFVVDDVPHDWLLPRVSAVVHHGGAGTTAAGLRAGRPSLICPVLGDQPFWAEQVRALGAGPDPLPWRSLNAARLEARLRRLVADDGYRHRAHRLGELISAEDGPGEAIRVLESLAS